MVVVGDIPSTQKQGERRSMVLTSEFARSGNSNRRDYNYPPIDAVCIYVTLKTPNQKEIQTCLRT